MREAEEVGNDTIYHHRILVNDTAGQLKGSPRRATVINCGYVIHVHTARKVACTAQPIQSHADASEIDERERFCSQFGCSRLVVVHHHTLVCCHRLYWAAAAASRSPPQNIPGTVCHGHISAHTAGIDAQMVGGQRSGTQQHGCTSSSFSGPHLHVAGA